jgi:hypothetical protein
VGAVAARHARSLGPTVINERPPRPAAAVGGSPMGSCPGTQGMGFRSPVEMARNPSRNPARVAPRSESSTPTRPIARDRRGQAQRCRKPRTRGRGFPRPKSVPPAATKTSPCAAAHRTRRRSPGSGPAHDGCEPPGERTRRARTDPPGGQKKADPRRGPPPCKPRVRSLTALTASSCGPRGRRRRASRRRPAPGAWRRPSRGAR